MSDRQLLVSKIENGIVIDHIPAGKAFLVLKLLKVDPSARALIAHPSTDSDAVLAVKWFCVLSGAWDRTGGDS